MLAATAYVPWQPANGENLVPHPTDVCEPINLAATAQPALVYGLKSPGAGLSTLQRETICRIVQSFAARGTFLLGDATGVGKGRTIAGLICELVHAQRDARFVWLSASVRLETDARAEVAGVDCPTGFDESVVFSSYAAMQNATRASEIVTWLSASVSPVLILDECHALRNIKGVSAQVVENIVRHVQSATPLKLLYSSATACSTPRHMAYLGRLGLFGTNESPFSDFEALAKALRMHGASLMELMAIDLRSRGAYVARQLSFANIQVHHRVAALTEQQRAVYDNCGAALRAVNYMRGSVPQSFFQRLLTAFKVDEAIRVVEQHVARGSSVVVSLVNTGEAALKRREETAKRDRSITCEPLAVGEETLTELDAEPVADLPENPLDRLINHFGSENIAELTGRKRRYIRRHGRVWCEKTGKIRDEVADFQHGRKHVAVLSRAGGIGISLHDAVDGRPRVHVILEMPWSAEDLLQQMGRTHRSNSQHPPTYILLTSTVPAEMRFASSIVNKLQSFGALVKADRSSCSFAFLKVPRWSAAERRSMDLYLAAASAIRADDPALPQLDRHQALLACQCEHEQSNENRVKIRVTNMLHHAEEFGDRRRTIVAASAALFPHDLTMLMHRWSPNRHAKFPRSFKQQALCVLLCAQAWETQGTLGLLSKDLLVYIVELMACPVSISSAQRAAARFREHQLHELGSMSVDTILNRMLGMEIAIQQDILSIADAFVQPERPLPTACLLRYATERAGPCVESTIADITHASFDNTVTGVCVELRYDILRTRLPSDGTQYWCHSKSGRMCWLDVASQHIVFADGVEVRLPSCGAHVMQNREYYRCSAHEWIVHVGRIETNARRRIRKLPTRFFLATTNAMKCWDKSSHRILRVKPTTTFPQGIVGLLMHASR